MPYPRSTHCRRGHPFDRTNTYVRHDGRRMCRTCANERQRERRATRKCPRCYGTGRVLHRNAEGRLERAFAPCPLCGPPKGGAPA